VFGISFSEFLVLGTVALLVLGPDKLPGLLRTLGKWLAKLRKLTSEVRSQSGIDDVLRSEGFDGGLHELRSLMRGGLGSTVFAQHAPQLPTPAPARDHFAPDKSREYPAEGADSYGALPEDLVPGFEPAVVTAPEPDAPHPMLPALPTPAVPALPNAAAPALPDAAVPQLGAPPALAEQPAERDANQPAATPPEGPG
jgi:sec-independent protein translocase protein TatB